MRTFKNLTYLNLAQNDFKILPEWISELPLKTLVIKNNRLTEIPSNLPLKMITLNFSLNYVKCVSSSLNLLKNLEHVDWEGNLIQFSPKRILSKGTISTTSQKSSFLFRISLVHIYRRNP